ncbi:MAG TPA: hypothetical protein VH186_20755 [Chloroflexia bacterium]|nr:hypothetical protein [Chloroflexia bacterium]
MDEVKIKVNEPGTPFEDEPIEEFTTADFDRSARSVGTGAANLVGQVGRLYLNVLTLPLNLLPAKSRYHAKKSLREGFLSVKTLVDEVNNTIDHTLTRSMERDRLRMNDLEDEVIPPATPDVTPRSGAI